MKYIKIICMFAIMIATAATVSAHSARPETMDLLNRCHRGPMTLEELKAQLLGVKPWDGGWMVTRESVLDFLEISANKANENRFTAEGKKFHIETADTVIELTYIERDMILKMIEYSELHHATSGTFINTGGDDNREVAVTGDGSPIMITPDSPRDFMVYRFPHDGIMLALIKFTAEKNPKDSLCCNPTWATVFNIEEQVAETPQDTTSAPVAKSTYDTLPGTNTSANHFQRNYEEENFQTENYSTRNSGQHFVAAPDYGYQDYYSPGIGLHASAQVGWGGYSGYPSGGGGSWVNAPSNNQSWNYAPTITYAPTIIDESVHQNTQYNINESHWTIYNGDTIIIFINPVTHQPDTIWHGGPHTAPDSLYANNGGPFPTASDSLSGDYAVDTGGRGFHNHSLDQLFGSGRNSHLNKSQATDSTRANVVSQDIKQPVKTDTKADAVADVKIPDTRHFDIKGETAVTTAPPTIKSNAVDGNHFTIPDTRGNIVKNETLTGGIKNVVTGTDHVVIPDTRHDVKNDATPTITSANPIKTGTGEINIPDPRIKGDALNGGTKLPPVIVRNDPKDNVPVIRNNTFNGVDPKSLTLTEDGVGNNSGSGNIFGSGTDGYVPPVKYTEQVKIKYNQPVNHTDDAMAYAGTTKDIKGTSYLNNNNNSDVPAVNDIKTTRANGSPNPWIKNNDPKAGSYQNPKDVKLNTTKDTRNNNYSQPNQYVNDKNNDVKQSNTDVKSDGKTPRTKYVKETPKNNSYSEVKQPKKQPVKQQAKQQQQPKKNFQPKTASKQSRVQKDQKG